MIQSSPEVSGCFNNWSITPRGVEEGRCLPRLINYPQGLGVDRCRTRSVNYPQGYVGVPGGWGELHIDLHPESCLVPHLS